MATEAWIESAARKPQKRLIGADRLMDNHVLAMPAAEREYVLAERERAHRFVCRLARDDSDAADLLDKLGLVEEAS